LCGAAFEDVELFVRRKHVECRFGYGCELNWLSKA
jgi:hypothetical protein